MQQSFSDVEYGGKKRKTRKEKFLEEMESLVPWRKWIHLLEPYYPKAGNGRPPIGLEKMLRMYLVSIWFQLSDEMAEDSIYDVHSIRRFVGINLSEEDAPDATTLLRFRHLLEEKRLTEKLFNDLALLLQSKGYIVKEGTIVDASIVEAPKSKKNARRERDPEMGSTKKHGKPYFGMKIHIGTDSVNGLIHSVETTSANEHDITKAEELLHGDEEAVYGDAGYIGLDHREEMKDRTELRYEINLRKSMVDKMPEGPYKEQVQEEEREKSRVRARVEWPFHVMKNLFGYRKVRYKGLAKNTANVMMLAALANLYLCKMKGFVTA
jgi:IS5 family transposase